MDVKQNPFSLYDFLGYFTPGAIFIYGYIYAFNYKNSEIRSLSNIAESMGVEKADLYVPLILFSYAAGHLLNFISSITIERYALWALGYPSKYLLSVKHKGYFYSSENVLRRRIVRLSVFVILLPVSLWDLVLGKVFGFRDFYAKSLDATLVGIIKSKVLSLVSASGVLKPNQLNDSLFEQDFFRFVYHYAVEHASNHLQKMQNYVALYGFLRALSLLSVMLFWGIIIRCLLKSGDPTEKISELFFISIMCYIFFVAFVKFYRRFSLEALMAVCVIQNPINQSNVLTAVQEEKR
jgi:hypothetical protein